MTSEQATTLTYKSLENRADGVPIYQKIPDSIGSCGMIPREINYFIVHDYGQSKLDISHDRIPSSEQFELRFAHNVTKANDIIINDRLKTAETKLASSNKILPRNIILAAIYFAASIPLGIKSDSATQNAMKNPDVMQRADERAWKIAKWTASTHAQESIEAFQQDQPASFTVDDQAVKKLKQDFKKESLQLEATKTHFWDVAHGIIGYGFPIYFGFLALGSFGGMLRAGLKNTRLNKLKDQNEDARQEIAKAFIRHNWQPPENTQK